MSTDIFSKAALDKVIKENLPADAVAGEKVIVGTVDEHGAQVIVGFKLKPTGNGLNWEVQAAARHEWDNANSVGGKVLLRWQ